MKKLICLLCCGVLLLGAACKEEKKDPDAALQKTSASHAQMKTVMEIHDEVMPRMSEISKLAAELKPLADSTAQGMPYQEALTDLQQAHQAMMDWMRNFGDRFDPDEIMNGKTLSPQKEAWLDEEEEKVRALRDQINASIANAEETLEQAD